jgi:hypothetical protein
MAMRKLARIIFAIAAAGDACGRIAAEANGMGTTRTSVRRGHDGAGLAAAAALGMVLGLWLFAGAVEAVVVLLPPLAAAPIVP